MMREPPAGLSQEILAAVPKNAVPAAIEVTTADGTTFSETLFIASAPSDLALTIAETVTLLRPGETQRFSILLNNRGPSAQTGVVVTHTLAGGAQFISADSSVGAHSFANGVVQFSPGVLTNGASARLEVRARWNSEGVFTNRVKVLANELELAGTDNEIQTRTIVARDESRILRAESASSEYAVVLSWPVAPLPFVLQSSTNAAPAGQWFDVSPVPGVQNGRNRVTNQLDSLTKFYRLRLNP